MESDKLKPKRNGTDLVHLMKDYVEMMITDVKKDEKVGEKKALILDDDTLGYVSVVYARSTLLDKGVYFFD